MMAFFFTPSLRSVLLLSPLFSLASAQYFDNPAFGQFDPSFLSSATTMNTFSSPSSPPGSQPIGIPQFQPYKNPTSQTQPYSNPPTQTPPFTVSPPQPQEHKPDPAPQTWQPSPMPVAKPVPGHNSLPPKYGIPKAATHKPARVIKPVPASKLSTPNPPPTPSHHLPAPSVNSEGDIYRWLDAHNAERMRYGAGNVSWNPDLVAAAHSRASTCYFKHTPNNEYGENIAAGQQSLEEVCNDWANGHDEKDIFDPNAGPGSHGSDTHWTQMVWDTTKEIGCCFHTCEEMGGVSLGSGPIKYWVCEYHPAGNVIGQSAEHVNSGPGGAPRAAKPQQFESHTSSYGLAYGFRRRTRRHRSFSNKHKRMA